MGQERSFLEARHHEDTLRGLIRPDRALMPMSGVEEETRQEVEAEGAEEEAVTEGLSQGEPERNEMSSEDVREEEGE